MSNTQNPGYGAFDPAKALQVLWSKSGRNLTPSELQWFSEGAATFVTEFSSQLEDVLIDVACLVAADGSNKGHLHAGNLQNHGDVANLLYSVANQVNLLTGMVEIGSEATHLLFSQLEKGAQA